MKILGIAERIDDNFSKIDIEKLREGSKAMDFNDSYFLELKGFHPFKLVSNDSDLLKTDKDIQILTLL